MRGTTAGSNANVLKLCRKDAVGFTFLILVFALAVMLGKKTQLPQK
jgi:hypothetical protein